MRRIDRTELKAPAHVLDVELAAGVGIGEETVAVEQYNALWCLSRIEGVPQEISFWDVADDVKISIGALRDQLRAGMAATEHVTQELPPQQTAIPRLDMTVVICTRDRASGLHTTLASLQQQTDSDFRVLVVENGSRPAESAAVVEKVGLPRCRLRCRAACGPFPCPEPGTRGRRYRASRLDGRRRSRECRLGEPVAAGFRARGSPGRGVWRHAPGRTGIRSAGAVRAVRRI